MPRLALGVSDALAFMLFAIALAACRSATPVVDVATAEPTVAACVTHARGVATRHGICRAAYVSARTDADAATAILSLGTVEGWELADVTPITDPDEDYEFALMLPTGVDNACSNRHGYARSDQRAGPAYFIGAANELAQPRRRPSHLYIRRRVASRRRQTCGRP